MNTTDTTTQTAAAPVEEGNMGLFLKERNPAAWRALCESPASAAANRIWDLADDLQTELAAYLEAYGPDADRKVLRDAGFNIRFDDGEFPCVGGLTRHHFAGFLYALTEFLGTTQDLLPDQIEDDEDADDEGM